MKAQFLQTSSSFPAYAATPHYFPALRRARKASLANSVRFTWRVWIKAPRSKTGTPLHPNIYIYICTITLFCFLSFPLYFSVLFPDFTWIIYDKLDSQYENASFEPEDHRFFQCKVIFQPTCWVYVSWGWTFATNIKTTMWCLQFCHFVDLYWFMLPHPTIATITINFKPHLI